MKNLMIPFIALFISVANAEEPKTLDDLIDLRIAENKRLTELFIEEAVDLKEEEKVKKLEAELGAAWGDLLKYIKKSDDDKLKALMLKTELKQDIVNRLYDKEYAENFMEKATLVREQKEFEKQYLLLQKIAKSLNIDLK